VEDSLRVLMKTALISLEDIEAESQVQSKYAPVVKAIKSLVFSVNFERSL
jgi:hypothetical protein